MCNFMEPSVTDQEGGGVAQWSAAASRTDILRLFKLFWILTFYPIYVLYNFYKVLKAMYIVRTF